MDNSTEKEKNTMVDNPEPDENQTSEEKPARQTEKAELKNTEKEEVNITEETTVKKKDEKIVEDNKEVKEKILAKKIKKTDFTEEKVEPETEKKVAEKVEPEPDKKAVEKDEPIIDKETP
ncbi:MAG: hypothetical protein KAT38_11045, partial [Bacteroidales bacterium]|nr:hypothetical protein [Bacteroidales bacterium]